MKTIIAILVLLSACGDNSPPPVSPDAPEPHKPTCLNRDLELDPTCDYVFEGRVPYGFRCEDGAERPVGPEYPPSCWLFEATFYSDGSLKNLGKMCCTTEGPPVPLL